MGDERFDKSRRLLRRADFLRVQSTGASGRSRHFLVLVNLRNDATEPARLGIVASRKVGNAVARNRGRRRVREWFRRRPALPHGTEVVVILRAEAPDLPFAELERELETALARALRAARSPNLPTSTGQTPNRR